MHQKIQKQILLFMRGWGYSIIIAVVIAMTFRSAIAELNLVPTGSMKPTIVEGDRILVNKLSYDLKIPFTTRAVAVWGNPQRGDIVVFFSPKDGTRLIKRVIGVPNDVISMKQNRLYINGMPMAYDIPDSSDADTTAQDSDKNRLFFIENLEGKKHPVMITPSAFSLRTFQPITIPKDHYFMMGDNRDESGDSRYFGFVKRDQIVGEAVGIAFSFDKTEHYFPRWNRFFKELI